MNASTLVAVLNALDTAETSIANARALLLDALGVMPPEPPSSIGRMQIRRDTERDLEVVSEPVTLRPSDPRSEPAHVPPSSKFHMAPCVRCRAPVQVSASDAPVLCPNCVGKP